MTSKHMTNDSYTMTVENGVIKEFYLHGNETNLADVGGELGSACFTLKSDDLKTMEHDPLDQYRDRRTKYDRCSAESENSIAFTDSENRITTEYILDERGAIIHSETDNSEISEFGINLELNFMDKPDKHWQGQLLPTTPYTSSKGGYMYYIMSRPNGKFFSAVATTPCDGWKIKYSPYELGHFMLNLQFLASFDKLYNGSERKEISMRLRCADTLDEAFRQISEELNKPLVHIIKSGGTDGSAEVKVYGKADFLELCAPSGKVTETDLSGHIPLTEFGMYTVTPIYKNMRGLDAVLWHGTDLISLFDKSCDAIEEPYHPDRNLCEGGCFLWAMLLNMRLGNHLRYDKVARKELDIIMAKTDEYIERRTILPFPYDGFSAYHVYKSSRVQEQFFGVSILLEAYRVYKDESILEYAIASLNELVQNWMQNGMVYNGKDYTTVCCPMIPLVDMALFLKEQSDPRAEVFETAAAQMAEYLDKRGFDFPTEGHEKETQNPTLEDGPISCTALALFYYCAHIKRNDSYIEFAKEIMRFHNAWSMSTPDARINGSSFRWWETLWEGDGQGPAICAGHAWTIWRAESLFWGGILCRDDNMLLDSWNGFVTNFAKIQSDGSMYSCFEVDYFRGGGLDGIKQSLLQLSGENTDIEYTLAHSYPKHKDNSLSRYVWARSFDTWLKTAAVLYIDGKTICINAKLENGVLKTPDNIQQIYIGKVAEKNVCVLDTSKKLI